MANLKGTEQAYQRTVSWYETLCTTMDCIKEKNPAQFIAISDKLSVVYEALAEINNQLSECGSELELPTDSNILLNK